MVFESLVVELINKYLGDYVERLDTSQLSIGLLGGNATLDNLDIKPNAFDDFDLPIKVLQGHISKLTLKIPFKHLYSEPVVAELDGLYVLVVPNAAMSYNEEKEKKYLNEAKKKELRAIEEAKQREAERSGKISDAKKDSFGEKLAAQVLKNLQIRIRNIHLRYEDSYTCPSRPFTMGVTLANLSFQTTNEKGIPITIKDNSVKEFFKYVELTSLAVYWNSKSKTFNSMNRGPLKNIMRSTIISPDNPKQDFEYIIRPISSTAMMKVHMRPDLDGFSEPQMVANLEFMDIRLAFTKSQYCDVTAFLEALDRSWVRNKFRKYRPSLPIKGNSKKWWLFPYTVILEETIRRRKRMWSWDHISYHRRMYKKYIAVWEKKLQNSKFSPDDMRALEMCEEYLDVLNITLCRQQAELKVQKLEKKKAKENKQGWFGGWFSGGNKELSQENQSNLTAEQLAQKVREEMTQDEKEKLYKAIGYSEQGSQVDMPKEYVSLKLSFKLSRLGFLIIDRALKDPKIMKFSVNSLCANVSQRAGANAIAVSGHIESLEATGVKHANVDRLPILISSLNTSKSENSHLLTFSFETNPLDERADQIVKVNAEPLEIVYDAETINSIIEFSKPPEEITLQEISSTVLQSLEDVKEMTTAGIKHLVEKRMYTELHVDVKPSYFILPENGIYEPGCRLLLADMGSLQIESEKTNKHEGEAVSYDVMKEEAYDKFRVALSSIQLLMIEKGEDWQAIRKMKSSPNHIVQPFGLTFNLKKCIIANDMNLPLISINGCLPKLAVDISDLMLKSVLELVLHIPLPEAEPEEDITEQKKNETVQFESSYSEYTSRQYTTGRVLRAVKEVEGSESDSDYESCSETSEQSLNKPERSSKKERPNLTDVDLVFLIKSIQLNVSSKADLKSETKGILSLNMQDIGATVFKRRFDQEIRAYMGGFSVDVPQFLNPVTKKPISLLKTRSDQKNSDSNFLFIKLLITDKTAPGFLTTYANTRHNLVCEFKTVDVCLHQESLILLLTYANSLASVVDKPIQEKTGNTWAEKVGDNQNISRYSSQTSLFKGASPLGKVEKRLDDQRERRERRLEAAREAEQRGIQGLKVDIPEVSIIQWKITATMDKVKVLVCSEACDITKLSIKLLQLKMQKTYTKIDVAMNLANLNMMDTDPDALYKNIMWTEPNESIFAMNLTMYSESTQMKYLQQDLSRCDMQVDLQIGKVKLVFLYLYISKLLKFLENFQVATQAAAAKAQELHDATIQQVKAAMDTSTDERTKLDIRIHAPVIYMPQKSSSNNTLMVDFGFLRVCNQFDNVNNSKAIVDNMEIRLDNVKVSRAVMVDSSIRGEKSVVMPINIELFVSRNLSASWYHEIPNVEVVGKMKSVDIAMCQDDYRVIMETLQQNLSEKVEYNLDDHDFSNTTTKTDVQSSIDQKSKDKEGDQEVTEDETEKSSSWMAIKFNIQMEAVRIELFKGGIEMGEWNNAVPDSRKLALFTITGFKLVGFMKTDNVTQVDVRLASWLIEDTRPGALDKINRILETQVDKENAELITLIYEQDEKENKTVNINVRSVYFCVCLEYLLSISDFFLKANPQPLKPPATQRQNSRAKAKTQKADVKAPVLESRTSELSLSLTVDEPEIVLVEDINTQNTNCIIAKAAITFTFHQKLSCDIMNGKVDDMQVYFCPFETDKRSQYRLQILEPTSVNFYSYAPLGGSIHGDLQMEKIYINVTPATIQSLSKILGALGNYQGGENANDESEVDVNIVDSAFWKTHEYETSHLPFLGADESDEGFNVDETVEDGFDVATMLTDIEERRNEQITIQINDIKLVLESELGNKCVPMLIMESSVQGEMKNPSSSLSISIILEMAISYFNDSINTWEPLLETFPDDNNRRWTLDFEMITSDNSNLFDDEDWVDLGALQPPKNLFVVSSKDSMELTLSKTSMEVLSNLGKAFQDAYQLTSIQHEDKPTAPYTLVNQCGMNVRVTLENKFQWPQSADSKGTLELEQGKELCLYDTEIASTSVQLSRRAAKAYDSRKLTVLLPSSNAYDVIIEKSQTLIFPITKNNAEENSTPMEFCVETSAFLGSKTITFRSIMKVVNSTREVLQLYSKNSKDQMVQLTELEVDATYFVPITALYEKTCGIYLKPKFFDCEISSKGVTWSPPDKKETCMKTFASLECASSSGTAHIYSAEMSAIRGKDGVSQNERKVYHYCLTIRESLILHNQLPLDISYACENCRGDLEAGNKVYMTVFHTNSTIEVSFNYNSLEWVGVFKMTEKFDEFSVLQFDAKNGYESLTMDIGIHIQGDNSHYDITIYSPYWMINKTGLSLTYKTPDDYTIEHASTRPFILFSFRAKSLFGKKKNYVSCAYDSDSEDSKTTKKKAKQASAKSKADKKRHFAKGKAILQVCDSQWSEKFSLDTIGSKGRVTCKSSKQNKSAYEVGVAISLSTSGLTKIVTFMPYYMIINKSRLNLKTHEIADGSEWFDLPSGAAVPFWPLQPASKKMLMQCKIDDPDEELLTQPFPFYESHSILMKLESKYPGLYVEVCTNDEATLITFQDYQPGMAVALIVNNLKDLDIHYHQQDVNSENKLAPDHMILYAWEDAKEKRELVWYCSNSKKKNTTSLKLDAMDVFSINGVKYYWVTFMWKTQRVLLFTHDQKIAKNARLSVDLESIDQEFTLQMQAIGLSLVNDQNRQEIAYISITSSGVKWSQLKRNRRQRPLNLSTSNALEIAYENYINHIRAGEKTQEIVTIPPNVEVDLSKRQMLKPDKTDLVRSFEPAVYILYKTSPHQQHVHVRIYRVQIDNQQMDCIFPIVFAPVPPPKSVALDSGPKPLIEMSAVIGQVTAEVSRFKYFRVLIQEMQLEVDYGFLNNIFDFFAGSVAEYNELESFKTDRAMIDSTLLDTSVIQSIIKSGMKNLYDNLHISPIKMHVSFSLTGSHKDDSKKAALHSEMMNLFLKSVGIAITDVQDVIFKLAYFEKQNSLMSNQQLTDEITRHYMNQGIKQMYVLVFGLDVIGNPFGVIRGMAQGVEDLFYEPVRGAVLGPEEFVEGVALGVRSLFGHALGGVSGAVSRITGTLGKGIAALTLDEDYQRKRREEMARKPESMGAGLAQGGKGLVMGVVHGVTGIVVKPVEGAKKEGVEGFFKGMGKGLVGVVTRPVSGVVDFASSSFEGIRRVTDVGTEAVRMRPPRHIGEHGVIYPYDRREAEGNMILHILDKGKWNHSDNYEYHIATKNNKHLLMVTNKRVMLIEKNDIMGAWSHQWTLAFEDMNGLPNASEKSLIFPTKEKQKKLFSSSTLKYEVEIDPKFVPLVHSRILGIMNSE